MKKVLTLSILVTSAFVFAACSGVTQNLKTTQNGKKTNVPAANQKSGDTTKMGTISEAGGKYFLTEAGQPPKEIESYQVDLSLYVGKTVKVTGQYSGDTLFVGSVE